MKYRLLAIMIVVLFHGCKKEESPGPEPCQCYGEYFLFSDSTGHYFLPTAFTPNGDGRNDVYRLAGNSLDSIVPGSFSLVVKNADNQSVFQSNDPQQSWDGSTLSKKVSGTKYFRK